MKKPIIQLFSIAAIAILFCSCEFKETTTIHENGSGTYNYTFNVSMAELLKDFPKSPPSDSAAIDQTKTDTITDVLTENNYKAYLDDNFSKKQMRENQDFLDYFGSLMKNTTITSKRTKGEPSNISISKKFSNISEIIDGNKMFVNYIMFEGIRKDKKSDKEELKSAEEVLKGSNMIISYDNKGFSKQYTGKMADNEALKKDMKNSKDMELMSSMGTMMGYEAVYNFDKTIKSVNNENAVIAADKKSVTIKTNFMEVLAKPEVLNLKVKF